MFGSIAIRQRIIVSAFLRASAIFFCVILPFSNVQMVDAAQKSDLNMRRKLVNHLDIAPSIPMHSNFSKYKSFLIRHANFYSTEKRKN